MKKEYDKIIWCKDVKNGFEIVESNDNLAKAYLNKALSALDATNSLKENKEWQISSCYYSMYFSLYSVMMKIGVKCENHTCSLEFMKVFLIGKFYIDEVELLKEAMKARIDMQYYSDRNIDENFRKEMISYAPKFYAKCKEIVNLIKEKEIDSIIQSLKEIK